MSRKAVLASMTIGILSITAVACLTLLAAPAAAATTGCAVTYLNLNAWQSSATDGGFSANLAITNFGEPISQWTLTFTMPAGHTATSGWNATFSIPSPGSSTVSASDAGWNGAIATGATNATVGMQGTWSRSSPGSAPPSPFPQSQPHQRSNCWTGRPRGEPLLRSPRRKGSVQSER